MPIHEYQCGACGLDFERLVRLGTPETEVDCRHCGEREVKKKLSVFAAHTSSRGSTSFSAASAASVPCGTPSPGGGCGSGGCMNN